MSTELRFLPRLTDGVDPSSLPLSAEEALVLSRVDGLSSEVEIAKSTQLDPNRVWQILQRLATLGIIRGAAPSAPVGVSTKPPQRRISGSHLAVTPPRIKTDDNLDEHSGIAEIVAIDLDLQKTISERFLALEKSCHYELLGVPRNADKKQIRAAYYEQVNVFHPDRYFGKNLGSFKAKLERIFASVTQAYDVLSRLEARAEYDRYLDAQSRTQELDSLASPASVQDQLTLLEQKLEREVVEALKSADSLPPARAADSGRPSQADEKLDPDARKRALARKLGGVAMKPRSIPPAPSSAPPVPTKESEAAKKAQAREYFQRQYDERLRQGKRRHIEQFLTQAQDHVVRGSWTQAARALKVAASLAPEDQALQARANQAEAEALRVAADSYLEQAHYAQQTGQMVEAARCYARAAQGKGDARLFERAAHCLLAANSDLRAARDYAREAVNLTPQDAQARITLARTFLAGGMKESAEKELERALSLGKKDNSIVDLVKKVRRGEAI